MRNNGAHKRIEQRFSRRWYFTGSYTAKGPIAVVSLFVLGAVARLYHSTRFDPWFDEIITQRYTFQSITKLATAANTSFSHVFLDRLRTDFHSPFYYLTVYLFSFFFRGENDIRLLSVFFSLCFLAGFYALARLLLNQKASLFALFLAVINPLHIWYAQEARGYALFSFVGVVTAYFLIKALRTKQKKDWGHFLLSGMAASLINPLCAVFFLVVPLVALPWNRIQHVLKLLYGTGIFLLFCAVSNFFNPVKTISWIPPLSWKLIGMNFGVFQFGYSTVWWCYGAGIVIIALLYAAGIISYYKTDRENAARLFILSIAPFLFVYGCSVLRFPFYLARYLLVFTPLSYIIIAQGVYTIKHRITRSAAAIVLCALMLSSLVNYYRGITVVQSGGRDFYPGIHKKKQWKSALRAVRNDIQEHDIIITTDVQSSVLAYSFFMDEESEDSVFRGKTPFVRFAYYPQQISSYEQASWRIGAQPIVPLNSDKDAPLCSFTVNMFRQRPFLYAQRKKGRIWLITSLWNPGGDLSPNTLKVREYLRKRYELVYSHADEGLGVEVYRNRDRGIEGAVNE